MELARPEKREQTKSGLTNAVQIDEKQNKIHFDQVGCG